MADRTAPAATSSAVARPIWMKQAEEAKLKSEAEKAAAAKAAFEATFKDVEKNAGKEPVSDDSDGEESEDFSKNKPLGPVDPGKCTAAGAGIAGGAACAASSFVVVTKDSDGRKIPTGGAVLKVKICPGVGVGGSEQEGMVKDQGDGTYMVTYVVPKRGNYMVHVDCNGKPIMGSPFPVFFSASNAGGLLGMPPTTAAAPFPNLVNQTMPNMPNYAGSVSGAFPGLLGMIPGVVPGASGGVVLPGVGSSLGEVCREYLNGRCAKTDCKFNHPPHNLLMTALAATTSMGTLSQVPMAPSAAAMAAAQAIVAAQALQAHAAQVQAQAARSAKDSSGSPEKAGKVDVLKKTLQVSNLSPLLTVEQLKQLFSYCGTVVECSITDSKHFAYIEYSKPEEATAALALNNMDVGGRPLNVEMAKSLPPKPAILGTPMNQASLPMVMQQAVAMQQMQFQQALLMQQTLTSQQAASRAATMKSATELASARAAEISKKLKAEGAVAEGKEPDIKQRSPSPSRERSKSKSRSPIKYRHSRRSRSFSPPIRRTRDRRSRSPLRSRHHRNYDSEHRYHRDVTDRPDRARRWERERSRDHYSSVSRKNRSRSVSPQTRKPSKASLASPKRRRGYHDSSRSPRHRRGSRSSPRRAYESTSHHRRRSRSKSLEDTSYRRRRSRSKSVEDTKNHARHSRSKSIEDRVHVSSKRYESQSEKLKTDERNHKNDEAMEERHLKAEDMRDGYEDDEINRGILDPSRVSLKKSLSLSKDVKNLTDGKIEIKSKSSDEDENDTENLEATVKNQTHFESSMSDSSEDKRLAASPVLGFNNTSTPVDDKTHSRSKDKRRSEKQSEIRRKEKSETPRAERSISDKYRSHAVDEDLSRRGRSSSDYNKHEKLESARREKGVLEDDSREGGWKPPDHSKSKSHKISSKNLEEIGGRKDRYRSEKRRREISCVADVTSDDFGVSETKDRVSRYSKSKSQRTSSPIEDGIPSDRKYNCKREKKELRKDNLDMNDAFFNEGNKNVKDLEGLREDGYATYDSINLDGDGNPEHPSPKLKGHDSKHYDSEGSREDLMVPRSSMEKIEEKESSFPDEENFAYAKDLPQDGRPVSDSDKFDKITDQKYDNDGTNYLDFDEQINRTSADSKEQYTQEELVEDKVGCLAKSTICEGTSALEGHQSLDAEEILMHDGC